MTTSFWDSLELRKQFSECATLRDIIVKLESDFSARGEVICEIRVNGMVLSEADEASFASSSREEIRELSVSSNRPDQLILEALESATTYIPDLEKNCVQAADSLRGTSMTEAQTEFGRTLEGCQWLVETLTHIRGAASGIGQPISRTERWYEAEKTIARVVREVSEAYTANDSVLVADLLEYEMTSALQIWRGAISEEKAHRLVSQPA